MQNAAQLLELLKEDPVWLEERSRPMCLARHCGGAMRDERLLAMFADEEEAGGQEAGGRGGGGRGGRRAGAAAGGGAAGGGAAGGGGAGGWRG